MGENVGCSSRRWLYATLSRSRSRCVVGTVAPREAAAAAVAAADAEDEADNVVWLR